MSECKHFVILKPGFIFSCVCVDWGVKCELDIRYARTRVSRICLSVIQQPSVSHLLSSHDPLLHYIVNLSILLYLYRPYNMKTIANSKTMNHSYISLRGKDKSKNISISCWMCYGLMRFNHVNEKCLLVLKDSWLMEKQFYYQKFALKLFLTVVFISGHVFV